MEDAREVGRAVAEPVRWISLAALAIPAAVSAQQPGSHIAVIEADSTILEPGTPFPFNGRSLIFEPSAGGYTIATTPLDFEEQRGARSAAYYAEAIEIPLAFPFRFFGRTYRTVYAYMHGVVMFARAEPPDPRLYPAVLTRQPPLIAALYHSAQSSPPGAGRADGLYVNALPDRVVITWYQVMPAQVEGILNTFQAILYRDGRIRVAYQDMQDPEGLVGLSTGDIAPNPAEVRLLDHERTPLSNTFYQWFRKPAFDSRAVARAFYRTYPDSFDALAIFEDFPVSHPAVSLYVPVKNDVRGIGSELFDHTAEFGSAGRLQGVLNLNNLEMLGPSPSTGMLGHEFGHRWLASVAFLDGGRRSADLVTGSHWCYYLDTRTGRTWRDVATTSFMFGNLWDELPDGTFRTGRATGWGYSPLDLYLMGLVPADSVPDFFYVADVPGQGPECSVSGTSEVRGRKKVVTIGQVIAAEGRRDPDVTRSQKQFRIGFILLVPPGRQPSIAELALLERLRLDWERDFGEYTGGRATMDARLHWEGTGPPLPRDTVRQPAAGGGAGRFRLATEPAFFLLQWSTGGPVRRSRIPRAWLVPKRAQARERDAYVSSFKYDTAVTGFAIGNGTIGLHVSSYAIQEEGSAGAAAGRDVFLVLDPRSGVVQPGLVGLGITKARMRVGECGVASTSHFLTADVDGDGFTDIGKVDERVFCLGGPRYEQHPVTWFLFRAGRWQADSNYRGRMPDRPAELPLIGLGLTPVDFMAHAIWRTYDASKWAARSASPAPPFVPAHRRRLALEERGHQ